MSDLIRQELWDKTDEIMGDTLNDFASFFSEKHIAAIKKYQSTDFEQLP